MALLRVPRFLTIIVVDGNSHTQGRTARIHNAETRRSDAQRYREGGGPAPPPAHPVHQPNPRKQVPKEGRCRQAGEARPRLDGVRRYSGGAAEDQAHSRHDELGKEEYAPGTSHELPDEDGRDDGDVGPCRSEDRSRPRMLVSSPHFHVLQGHAHTLRNGGGGVKKRAMLVTSAPVTIDRTNRLKRQREGIDNLTREMLQQKAVSMFSVK